MVTVKAIGVAAKECGWASRIFEAKSLDDLLQSLPSNVLDMKKRGELVILLNGTELSAIEGNCQLSEQDSVVLLPVVHGG
ncbi:MAG: hypothetical protein QXX17_02085 [Conexivisphaerales archaeon]